MDTRPPLSVGWCSRSLPCEPGPGPAEAGASLAGQPGSAAAGAVGFCEEPVRPGRAESGTGGGHGLRVRGRAGRVGGRQTATLLGGRDGAAGGWVARLGPN